MDSQDRERHRMDNKKHPITDPFPHPSHKSQQHNIKPLHHPHKHEPEYIKHFREDKPKPGKITKKFKYQNFYTIYIND
jgi:hypothetical protein